MIFVSLGCELHRGSVGFSLTSLFPCSHSVTHGYEICSFMSSRPLQKDRPLHIFTHVLLSIPVGKDWSLTIITWKYLTFPWGWHHTAHCPSVQGWTVTSPDLWGVYDSVPPEPTSSVPYSPRQEQLCECVNLWVGYRISGDFRRVFDYWPAHPTPSKALLILRVLDSACLRTSACFPWSIPSRLLSGWIATNLTHASAEALGAPQSPGLSPRSVVPPCIWHRIFTNEVILSLLAVQSFWCLSKECRGEWGRGGWSVSSGRVEHSQGMRVDNGQVGCCDNLHVKDFCSSKVSRWLSLRGIFLFRWWVGSFDWLLREGGDGISCSDQKASSRW